MSILIEACDVYETEITIKNPTEVMVIAKEPEQCSVQLNNTDISQMDTFTCPGTLITGNGKYIREIKCRIAPSNVAFNNSF